MTCRCRSLNSLYFFLVSLVNVFMIMITVSHMAASQRRVAGIAAGRLASTVLYDKGWRGPLPALLFASCVPRIHTLYGMHLCLPTAEP